VFLFPIQGIILTEKTQKSGRPDLNPRPFNPPEEVTRARTVTPASPTAFRMSTPQIHTLLTPVKPSMLNSIGQTVLMAVVLTKVKVAIFTLVKAVISC